MSKAIADLLDFQARSQVISLRKLGYTVNDISEQLGLHSNTERQAIQQICDSRELRPYMRGIESTKPVRRQWSI
ncbi:MAG: hypothetical protein RLZ25_1615 [Pseudomonadota bacterium]|jgi:DNA-binding transcriptional MerR regulator